MFWKKSTFPTANFVEHVRVLNSNVCHQVIYTVSIAIKVELPFTIIHTNEIRHLKINLKLWNEDYKIERFCWKFHIDCAFFMCGKEECSVVDLV